MTDYLYHYTSEAGLQGIKDTMFIEVSSDTTRDAVLGRGVYLTDLPPTTDKETLLRNNYGGGSGQENKIAYCFRFPKSELRGCKKQRLGNRVIYMYPGRINLRNVTYQVKKQTGGSSAGKQDDDSWGTMSSLLVAGGLLAVGVLAVSAFVGWLKGDDSEEEEKKRRERMN